MRKLFTAYLLSCCMLIPALAQKGGKWIHEEGFSSKTGKPQNMVSVQSLSEVLGSRATLALIQEEGGPTVAIDMGKVWVVSTNEIKTWFDEEEPVNVVYTAMEKHCGGEFPCTTLFASTGEMPKRLNLTNPIPKLLRAGLMRIQFWASNGKQYIHTFPVSGLATHARFIGLKIHK